MSNPPSRGSGQGGPKTYGKHEVPSVNVEGEEGENGHVGGRTEKGDEPNRLVLNKHLARPAALIHSRSFPNTSSLVSSPASSPNGSLRRQLPPSRVKLPVPPASLLNGLPNVQKSASSASLNLHMSTGVTTSAGKSDGLRETVTVPNVGQMLIAARAELLNEAAKRTAGPRPALSRLPPLQMPKGPTEEEKTREGQPEEGQGERRGEEDSSSTGPIATLAKESMPQLRHLQPLKIPPVNLGPESPSPLPPPSSQAHSLPHSPVASPQPTIMPSPLPPARVPPLHSVPNEVPVHHSHQHPAGFNPRRRPSSAGQLGAIKDAALVLSKPLPAISQPNGVKRMPSSRGTSNSPRKFGQFKHRRLALKFAGVCLCLSIPVVIFLLVMLFTNGFSPSSPSPTANSSSSSPLPTLSPVPSTSTPSPTPINIVGGAIFAPISMQNESAPFGSVG